MHGILCVILREFGCSARNEQFKKKRVLANKNESLHFEGLLSVVSLAREQLFLQDAPSSYHQI